MEAKKGFKTMEKLDIAASNKWARLKQLQSKWEAQKERLEKDGTWDEYCDAKGWSRNASFFDIGA